MSRSRSQRNSLASGKRIFVRRRRKGVAYTSFLLPLGPSALKGLICCLGRRGKNFRCERGRSYGALFLASVGRKLKEPSGAVAMRCALPLPPPPTRCVFSSEFSSGETAMTYWPRLLTCLLFLHEKVLFSPFIKGGIKSNLAFAIFLVVQHQTGGNGHY